VSRGRKLGGGQGGGGCRVGSRSVAGEEAGGGGMEGRKRRGL
jgi:hypothetical protein